jgi:hypothetical protein
VATRTTILGTPQSVEVNDNLNAVHAKNKTHRSPSGNMLHGSSSGHWAESVQKPLGNPKKIISEHPNPLT